MALINIICNHLIANGNYRIRIRAIPYLTHTDYRIGFFVG